MSDRINGCIYTSQWVTAPSGTKNFHISIPTQQVTGIPTDKLKINVSVLIVLCMYSVYECLRVLCSINVILICEPKGNAVLNSFILIVSKSCLCFFYKSRGY